MYDCMMANKQRTGNKETKNPQLLYREGSENEDKNIRNDSIKTDIPIPTKNFMNYPTLPRTREDSKCNRLLQAE